MVLTPFVLFFSLPRSAGEYNCLLIATSSAENKKEGFTAILAMSSLELTEQRGLNKCSNQMSAALLSTYPALAGNTKP